MDDGESSSGEPDPLIFSFYAWIIIATLTIFWGFLSLVGSLFDSSGRFHHRCSIIWSRWILGLCRIPVHLSGPGLQEDAGPCILMPNHQGAFDIFVFSARLPRAFRWVAKESLFRIPVLGWSMSRGGTVALDRGRGRKAVHALRSAQSVLETGTSILIFPEGTRSATGRLGDFKNGGFKLAVRANVPIVPIAVRGSAGVLRRGSMRIRPSTITVYVGEAIRAHTDDGLAWKSLQSDVKEAIGEGLEILEKNDL